MQRVDGALSRVAVEDILFDANEDVDVRAFGAIGSGDETTQVRDALTYGKTNRRSVRMRAGTVYQIDSLSLDFSADPTTTDQGFRPPCLRGGGPRSTVIQQLAGATEPLISITGADSGNSHNGKVIGMGVSDLELRGTGSVDGNGRGTGGSAPGIYLSIYQFAHLENLYISRFTDAIQLDRPVKSPTRDDMSHLAELESIKAFQNSNAGLRCVSDDNAIGPVAIINMEASYNGGIGFDLVSSGITMIGSSALGNGGYGLYLRDADGLYSDVLGFAAYASRFEGNDTYEVLIDSSLSPLFSDCIWVGSAGADCLVAGLTAAQVRNLVVVGGLFSGDGATAGQKWCHLGSNANGAAFFNPRIETGGFVDITDNDPMVAYTDNPTGNTYMQLTGASIRTLLTHQFRSSASVALAVRLFSDSNRRFAMLASGEMQWGTGTASADTNLYRSAANTLKSDDKLIAALGLGVGNSVSASSLGTVTRKVELFDASGSSLGFVPVYDAIT